LTTREPSSGKELRTSESLLVPEVELNVRYLEKKEVLQIPSTFTWEQVSIPSPLSVKNCLLCEIVHKNCEWREEKGDVGPAQTSGKDIVLPKEIGSDESSD